MYSKSASGEEEKNVAEHADGQNQEKSNVAWLVVALCAIAASTMIVEIVLTKFVAFKVFHNFIGIIISTVVLSFSAAGTFLYMQSDKASARGAAGWKAASREAAIYALTLIASILIFCWIPIDPYNLALPGILRVISVPAYFIMFACPFFFAGLCITRVLAHSPLPASRVYLYDLLAAAIAASFAPPLLDVIGGYGAIGLSAALGMIGYFAFMRASGEAKASSVTAWSAAFVVAMVLLLLYPSWSMSRYGFDIRSAKYQAQLRDLILNTFGGVERTYWNALARIDISHSGRSNHESFIYGAPLNFNPTFDGRIITVDCGANTRQFKAEGKISDYKVFGQYLWAVPYVMRPDAKDSLIIGGGGGLDIVVAKFFKIPNIDVAEMNPMTYKHILLGEDDPERDEYQPWITSDATSHVSIYNNEARHFCSTRAPQSYDVILASGVDTLTAVASGALAFSDNYLYTYDAIKSYVRLLKPGGVLSLTNWRTPSTYALRLLVTYENVLEDSGVKEPWRNVVVVAATPVAIVLKTTPFTEPELQRLRNWCKETGDDLLFDPGRRTPLVGTKEDDGPYVELGFGNREQREQFLKNYKFDVTPATDDKPYFYKFERNENWLLSSAFSYTPLAATVVIFIFSIVLILCPWLKLKNRTVTSSMFVHATFFALCGFAFLLFEVAIVQLFSVFVGGPVYAMAVVLVSVLMGYSIGSYIAGFVPHRPLTFVVLGVGLCLLSGALELFLPSAVSQMLALPFSARLVACAAITLTSSMVIGIPVPLAMEAIKRQSEDEVAWLWGVSSAFNALGSASFVLISQRTGIAATLGIVAVLYLLAGLLFAARGPLNRSATSSD